MEIACNPNCPVDFKTEDAITSNNGLALLASLTLKNALKISNNYSDSSSSNNINRDKYKKVVLDEDKIASIQQQSQCNNSGKINNNNYSNDNKQLQLNYGAKINGGIVDGYHQSSTEKVTTPNAISTVAQKEQSSKVTNNVAIALPNSLQQTVIINTQLQTTPVTPINLNRRKHYDGHVSTLSTAKTASPSSLNGNTALTPEIPKVTSIIKDTSTNIWEPLKVSPINTNDSTSNINNNSSIVNITTITSTPTTTLQPNTTTPVSVSKYFQIPSDILDDLASRFIINVPEIEQQTVIRVCFQIELAHWFYLDFFCMNEECKLQPCGMKHFAMQLFEHIPFLRQHLPSVDVILDDWKNYKLSVPTYGAILISEDLNYCLLVQSYFAKSSWGFPKGKVNENEDPIHCAQREVFEETGFDITKLVIPNDFIESVHNYQVTRLYIVQNVPLETKFIPRTRNEIKSCDWFPIDALPVNKNDSISKVKLGLNANSFFMIIPFVKRLKKWIHDKRNEQVDILAAPIALSGDNNNVNNVSSSPIDSPSTLNALYNNGHQVQQKFNSTGKKQKQRSNNNNNVSHLNYNSDDNHKCVRQNNSSSGNVGVQRALSYTQTKIQNNQLQQHHQHGDTACGNYCNNDLNSTPTTISATSNYSKRQRHKSMGDLDGIKLSNNFNHNNNNKNIAKTLNTQVSTNNNKHQQKRNLVKIHRGTVDSVVTSTAIPTTSNHLPSIIVHQSRDKDLKRQLFYNEQHQQKSGLCDQKEVSSFELIRREKQQIKTAAMKFKAQKQQQSNNDGRVRAKSQSDKLSNNNNSTNNNDYNNIGDIKMQAVCNNNLNSNNNNNDNNNNVINNARTPKQKCMIINNSENNISNNHHHHQQQPNKNNHKINKSKNINKVKSNNTNHIKVNHKISDILVKNNVEQCVNAEMLKTSSTPSPISSQEEEEVLAQANSSVTKKPQTQSTSSIDMKITTPISVVRREMSDLTTTNILQIQSLQQEGQHRIANIKRNIMNDTSGKKLNRSTSHQLSTMHTQPQPQQWPVLEFQPSLNSWTNFSFTKNFIANVFC